MSACEKCWSDAGGDAHAYARLVLAREKADQVCTDEEQAGPGAKECHGCGRKTLHQHTGVPMCDCPEKVAHCPDHHYRAAGWCPYCGDTLEAARARNAVLSTDVSAERP